MRQIIKSAVPLGYRPDDVRGMVPCDWLLVVRGHNAAAQAQKPGGRAPSKAEIEELLRLDSERS